MVTDLDKQPLTFALYNRTSCGVIIPASFSLLVHLTRLNLPTKDEPPNIYCSARRIITYIILYLFVYDILKTCFRPRASVPPLLFYPCLSSHRSIEDAFPHSIALPKV